MKNAFTDITFTPSVRHAQELAGHCLACFPQHGPVVNDRLGSDEAAFIAAQRNFYLATVSADGWPYVQHRGGAPGFLQAIDESTLAFVDVAGNRQLISLGNIADNDRVALILVDYETRSRLKILGTMSAEPFDAGREEFSHLVGAGLRGRPQRVMTIKVAAFDWNCPQHIPRRFEEEDVMRLLAERDKRIAELERQLQEPPPGR